MSVLFVVMCDLTSNGGTGGRAAAPAGNRACPTNIASQLPSRPPVHRRAALSEWDPPFSWCSSAVWLFIPDGVIYDLDSRRTQIWKERWGNITQWYLVGPGHSRRVKAALGWAGACEKQDRRWIWCVYMCAGWPPRPSRRGGGQQKRDM